MLLFPPKRFSSPLSDVSPRSQEHARRKTEGLVPEYLLCAHLFLSRRRRVRVPACLCADCQGARSGAAGQRHAQWLGECDAGPEYRNPAISAVESGNRWRASKRAIEAGVQHLARSGAIGQRAQKFSAILTAFGHPSSFDKDAYSGDSSFRIPGSALTNRKAHPRFGSLDT